MLGQQVVVEDVTGAGGTIGATKAARAEPDGYTLVMGNLGTHAAALGIYSNLAYDPRKISSRSSWSPRRRWSGGDKDAAGENAQRRRRLDQGQ